jgi:predicted glycogen debranching enzyme
VRGELLVLAAGEAIPEREWLEADGLGGFASGTATGERTRRYHALLLVATTPPTGRFVLVNGLEVEAETAAGRFALSSDRYAPDVLAPDGARRLARFALAPWPRFTWTLPDGTCIEHELFVPRGAPAVALAWRASGAPPGGVRLRVRPLFSGRDYHALHHENPSFDFAPEAGPAGSPPEKLLFRPYPGVPGVALRSNGRFEAEPLWYRRFLYTRERERGLDHLEDLAAPGVLHYDLAAGDACLLLAATLPGETSLEEGLPVAEAVARLRARETTRRASFATPLALAAGAYLVKRDGGRTIVAGYPWFTDWGRDTFIALRGLCLATGRLDEARDILLAWSGTVSEGMLPNRFVDAGDAPDFNSVDASLWYVVAVHAWRDALAAAGRTPAPEHAKAMQEAVAAILDGYSRGTRHGIRADPDGLLACGVPGVQLTWMDARVGDRVVTPRIGKPVEVQALWINALRLATEADARWRSLAERAAESFDARFWNEARGCLFDVVDVDHRAGACDGALRPNQLLAVGGLPHVLLEGERARRVVELAEATLLTPLGLRTLAPGEPGYRPRCAGNVAERDAAYHQGTAWPWLLGAFVEAWIRVRGGSAAAKREARARFLLPLERHRREAGLGHVSEIVDGEPPFTPRGCPFQAWSLAEWLRLEALLVERVER